MGVLGSVAVVFWDFQVFLGKTRARLDYFWHRKRSRSFLLLFLLHFLPVPALPTPLPRFPPRSCSFPQPGI